MANKSDEKCVKLRAIHGTDRESILWTIIISIIRVRKKMCIQTVAFINSSAFERTTQFDACPDHYTLPNELETGRAQTSKQ